MEIASELHVRSDGVAGEPVGAVVARPSVAVRQALAPELARVVRSVMRQFATIDQSASGASGSSLNCDACRQRRPCAGFIRYNQLLFCNDCAADYEVHRVRGLASAASEFIAASACQQPARWPRSGMQLESEARSGG
jgi:hypothetical protein